MITDLKGKPMLEGPTGRTILLKEHLIKNSKGVLNPTWAFEYQGNIEFIETVQVLIKVVDSLITRQRDALRHQLAMDSAANQIKKMNEELNHAK